MASSMARYGLDHVLESPKVSKVVYACSGSLGFGGWGAVRYGFELGLGSRVGFEWVGDRARRHAPEGGASTELEGRFLGLLERRLTL